MEWGGSVRVKVEVGYLDYAWVRSAFLRRLRSEASVFIKTYKIDREQRISSQYENILSTMFDRGPRGRSEGSPDGH